VQAETPGNTPRWWKEEARIMESIRHHLDTREHACTSACLSIPMSTNGRYHQGLESTHYLLVWHACFPGNEESLDCEVID